MKNIALALIAAASLSACTVVSADHVYHPPVYIPAPVYVAPSPVIIYRPYYRPHRCWRCY